MTTKRLALLATSPFWIWIPVWNIILYAVLMDMELQEMNE